MYCDDGSIGTLSIPKLVLSVKAYEGESLSNLAKGIGHFSSASAWDGNICFAGHNRGSAVYFGQIHNLQAGDKITYTTLLGTRVYEVYSARQISETDLTCLEPSAENTICLITCVMDNPPLRWCVIAK